MEHVAAASRVLLTPVTVLAGRRLSLTILLTLGYAGSAASLYWVLRQWGQPQRGRPGRGGLRILPGPGGVQQRPLPPPVRGAAAAHHPRRLLKLLTGRGHPLRTGAWLGVLTAAQLLTAEELLAQTAVTALVMVAALVACWPRAVPARAGGAAAGLATAAGVVMLTCGYALWIQFHGPLAEHGSPFPASPFRAGRTFVTPSGELLPHTRASGAAQPAIRPGCPSTSGTWAGR